MSKFIYVLDKVLANKYQSEGLILMQEIIIDDKRVWIFSTNNKELNFESVDKNKVLFTNRLMF